MDDKGSSIFVLDLSVKGRPCTLTDGNFLLDSFFFYLFFGFVKSLCILSEELHSDLRGVLNFASDLPFNYTEVNMTIFQDINGCVEELGIEEVTIENDSGETHPTLQARSLAFCLLNVLHILLFMLSSFLSNCSQVGDILVLWSQLSMCANHSIANLCWKVNLIIEL